MAVEKQTRAGNGRFERSIDTVQRDIRAAELRSESLTWMEIAEKLGYESPSGAYKAAQRGWQSIPTENLAEARALELAKLDRREQAMLRIMEAEHFAIDHGRVVLWKRKPQVNPMPNIAASNALGQIAKRRAALLGLDAPPRRYVEVITEEMMLEELKRLAALDEELQKILDEEEAKDRELEEQLQQRRKPAE